MPHTEPTTENEVRCPACGRFLVVVEGDACLRTRCQQCRRDITIRVSGQDICVKTSKGIAKIGSSVL